MSTTYQKDQIKTTYTSLSSASWTDVTITPSATSRIAITDIVLSSDTGTAKQQVRQYNGSSDEMVFIFNTASDRNEQCHFSEPVFLKAGYRLQITASAASHVTINYFVVD